MTESDIKKATANITEQLSNDIGDWAERLVDLTCDDADDDMCRDTDYEASGLRDSFQLAYTDAACGRGVVITVSVSVADISSSVEADNVPGMSQAQEDTINDNQRISNGL